MVIQRIQTLYLLIAAALMAWFSFMPFAANAAMSVTSLDNLPYFVYNMAIVLLLFINIFTYNTLRYQKMLTRILGWLVVGSAAIATQLLWFVYKDLAPAWPLVLIPAALIFVILAHRGMASDMRKLSGSDRLR